MFSVQLGKRGYVGDDVPKGSGTPGRAGGAVTTVVDDIFKDILADLGEDLAEGSDLDRILTIFSGVGQPIGAGSTLYDLDGSVGTIITDFSNQEGSDLSRILGIDLSDVSASGVGGGGSGAVTDQSSLTAEPLKGEIDRIFKVFSVWGEWIAGRLYMYDYTDADKAAEAIISDLSLSTEFTEIATTSSVPLARAVLERLFLDGILVKGSEQPTYKAPFWEIIFGLISFDIPDQVNPFLNALSSMGKDPIFDVISQKKGFSECIELVLTKLTAHQKGLLPFSQREQAWLTIAKGWDETTRSERPPVEFYETVSRQTSEERQRMYDAAYFDYHYPFLHEPVHPAEDIRACAYSINMVWLHERPQEGDEGLLYPEFESAMAPKALEWARSNPGTVVNLWYDGERVSSAAVERSGQRMRDMGGDDRIVFRNIRELPNDPMFFKEVVLEKRFNDVFNIDAELSDDSVYPRVDALRGCCITSG